MEKRDFILDQYSIYKGIEEDAFGIKIGDAYIERSFFEILIKIGHKYFYEFEFKLRRKVYQLAIKNFKKRKKEKLDGFLNTFEHLFLIIRNSKNKKIYYEYLYYNIDESEKFILFLMLGFEGLNEEFRRDLRTFFYQFDIIFSNNYFLSKPKEEIVKLEVDNLLNLYS